MSADPKAKAEVLAQLLQLITETSLAPMAEAQALWLESPIERQDLYAEYVAAKSTFDTALRDYVDARRELVRWGAMR